MSTLVKEGSFRINAKLVKEELRSTVCVSPTLGNGVLVEVNGVGENCVQLYTNPY